MPQATISQEDLMALRALIECELEKRKYPIIDSYCRRVIRTTTEYLLRAQHRKQTFPQFEDKKRAWFDWYAQGQIQTVTQMLLELGYVSENDERAVNLRNCCSNVVL